MTEPNQFEEMLATYPAEKRELAREVYHRFADGDSAQFFTQLFLVLDVYAHYAERIPIRMISANADSLATLQDVREEIGLIAKTIETRDVNITNHAEKTNELCRITQAKSNETVASVELMVKNLGARVDTQAIVKGVEYGFELRHSPDEGPFTVHPAHRGTGTAGDAGVGKGPGRSRRGRVVMVTADLEDRLGSQLIMEHLGSGNLDLPDLPGIRHLLRTQNGGPNRRHGEGDEIQSGGILKARDCPGAGQGGAGPK